MSYYMGVDLARKSDWTVATVIDDRGNVVQADRFHQISWSLQTERVALLYRTFGCAKAVVDSTGLGDVIVERLQEAGLVVEPYIFTLPSRKALIEELVLALDNVEITIPNTEKFRVFRAELESFEYSLDGSTIRYQAPPGQHDDTVMSLALAVHAFRSSRGAVLGMILLLQKRAKEIVEGVRNFAGDLLVPKKPAPKPVVIAQKTFVAPVVTRVIPKPEKLPTCPVCESTCVVRLGGPANVHCNSCSADFDVNGNITYRTPVTDTASHVHRWRAIPGGERCDDCGEQRSLEPVQAVGVSRADYARGVGKPKRWYES